MLEVFTSLFESYNNIIHNVYLTMALLFVFGLLDYRMTLIGDRIRKMKHSDFFELEHYEMNPVYQDAVKKRKYSYKHFLILVVLAILTFIFSIIHEYLFLTWQGVIFALYFIIIARHINLILKFKFTEKRPELLTGKIKQSYLYTLHQSKNDVIPFLFAFALIFAFSPSFFTFGTILGALLLLNIIQDWIKHQQKPISI